MGLISAERAANLVGYTKMDILTEVNKLITNAAEQGQTHVTANFSKYDVGYSREQEIIRDIQKAGYSVVRYEGRSDFQISWAKQLSELKKKRAEKPA